MPAAAAKLPGISVSDAFGLPDNWSLSESLRGVVPEGGRIAADPIIPDEAPDPDEIEKGAKGDEPPAGEEPDADAAEEAAKAAAAKEGESTVDDDKAEAAKNAADKKAAADAKAAELAKKTAKAGEKPLVGAAKAAADKKAADDAAKAKAAAAAAPKKIKVGGKDLTEEEIAARIKKADELEAAAATAAADKKKADAEAARKAAAAPKTPEEQAAANASEKKKEDEWLASTAAAISVSAMTEESMDKILSGGKEAVAELERIRREDMARTLLAARKDISKMYEPMADAVREMHTAHLAQQDRQMEDAIVAKHPYLSEHGELLRQHGMAMVKADPEGCREMTPDQFQDKVAELTIGYIRKYNAQFGVDPEPDAAAAAAAARRPGAPAAGARPAARPAVPPRRSPAPPSGNLPASPTGGGKGSPNQEFQKSAVASLL